MCPISLKCRIAALPLCHAFLILILFATGGPSLATDIVALSDKFRNCPVLNTRFVPFWFHSAFSILQLSLAFFISITLIVLSCKRPVNKESKESLGIKKHLVGAIGSTGAFITIRPDSHPHLIRDLEGKQIDLRRITLIGNDNLETNCCGRIRSKNDYTSSKCNRYGWLQPMTVLFIIIFVGHLASLIWFSRLRLTVSEPTEYFPSFLMDLFIEAKVYYWTDMISHNHGKPISKKENPFLPSTPNSFYCWTLIQLTFHCCGASAYMDWLQKNTNFQSSSDFMKYLPESCFCRRQNVSENKCYNQSVLETASGSVYTEGCLNPLMERLYNLFTIEIIVISCLVILISVGFFTDFAYTLCTAQKVLDEQQERDLSKQKYMTNSRQLWSNYAADKR